MSKGPFKAIDIQGRDPIKVEWNVKLGRLQEGYARGGDYGNNTIRIAPGQLTQGERAAVLHEVLHRLWEIAELDQWLSCKTEELVIDTMTSWILDTLQRNPVFTEWLAAGPD